MYCITRSCIRLCYPVILIYSLRLWTPSCVWSPFKWKSNILLLSNLYACPAIVPIAHRFISPKNIYLVNLSRIMLPANVVKTFGSDVNRVKIWLIDPGLFLGICQTVTYEEKLSFGYQGHISCIPTILWILSLMSKLLFPHFLRSLILYAYVRPDIRV